MINYAYASLLPKTLTERRGDSAGCEDRLLHTPPRVSARQGRRCFEARRNGTLPANTHGFRKRTHQFSIKQLDLANPLKKNVRCPLPGRSNRRKLHDTGALATAKVRTSKGLSIINPGKSEMKKSRTIELRHGLQRVVASQNIN